MYVRKRKVNFLTHVEVGGETGYVASELVFDFVSRADEGKRKRNSVSMWEPGRRRASIAVAGGLMVIVSAMVRLVRRVVAVFQEPSLYFELLETS